MRLNIIGPYASTHLLYTRLSPCLDEQVRLSATARTGILRADVKEDEDDVWGWAREAEDEVMREGGGPTMTWPLGEVLMGRHDFQHTRIFNS